MNAEKSLAVQIKEAKEMTGETYVKLVNEELSLYGGHPWRVMDISFDKNRMIRIYDNDHAENRYVLHDFSAPLFVEDALSFIFGAAVIGQRHFFAGKDVGRADNQKQLHAALGIKNENGEPEYYYNGPTA
jgi:hypothetical protein